jgi:arylsulfatase A-like enzyme
MKLRSNIVASLMTVGLASFLSTAFTFAANVSPREPNILIILADDLGYGDVACYNPTHGKIRMPSLDHFALQGMRFTDAHSSSAVCSPSRYSLLTGRYHWRTWLQSGIVNKFGPALIAPDRLTLADILRERGYRTACFGKWHMGWNWPIPHDREQEFIADPRNTSNPPNQSTRELWRKVFSQPIGGGPLECGFDTFFGMDLPNFPPFCFIDGNHTVGIPDEVLPAELMATNLADFSRPAVHNWRLDTILPEIGDRACQFIHDSAEQSKPFFLYLPITAPHTPIAVNQEWRGKSGLNAYADYVMETDAVIGQVLRELDQVKLTENTFVLISSDNGCAPYVGIEELARKGHYPNWPYRGFKTDIWEGGHRVPFIVRWPGSVQPGTTCDALVQQVDLVATVAEFLDEKLPPNVGEDSFSFMPLLRGGKEPTRNLAVNQSIKGLFAIRQGPWKLIFGQGSGGWAKGSDDKPQQLYRLDEDPTEEHNLFGQHQQLEEQLTEQMARIVAAGRSTPGPSQQNDMPVDWRRFLDTADDSSKN